MSIIVGIGQKVYGFLKFRKQPYNRFYLKKHFEPNNKAVMILHLSKIKWKVEYFDLQPVFLKQDSPGFCLAASCYLLSSAKCMAQKQKVIVSNL